MDVPGGRAPGLAVVLSSDHSSREPRPAVLTLDNQLRRIGIHDVEGPVAPITRIRIPKSFNAKVPKSRRDLASSVRNALRENRPPAPPQPQQRLRPAPRPCRTRKSGSPTCGGRSAPTPAMAAANVKTTPAGPNAGGSSARKRTGWSARSRAAPTPSPRPSTGCATSCPPTATWKPPSRTAQSISADGQRLRRIYGEKDLLISQSLRLGAFDDLDAAEVAALASVLVYQAKREDRGLRPEMPSVSLESAVDIVVREWSALEDVEEQNKLPLTGEPELGLVWPMYKWAKGRHLQEVLNGTDLAAGRLCPLGQAGH